MHMREIMQIVEGASDYERLRATWEDPGMLAAIEKEGGICSVHAGIISELENGQVFGFSQAENPGTFFDDEDEGEDEGHHFTLVGGRYIVDTWIAAVKDAKGRAVFDIKNPADADAIRYFYGDPANWTDITSEWKGKVSKQHVMAYLKQKGQL